MRGRVGAAARRARRAAAQVVLEAAGTRVAIDRATGQLASVERDGRRVSLANGPRIVDGQGEAHVAHAPRRRRRLRRRGGLRGQPEAGPLAARRQRLARALVPLREPGPPRAPRRHLRLPRGERHRPALARPRPVSASGRTASRARLRRLAEGLQRHAHRRRLGLPRVQGPPRRPLLGDAARRRSCRSRSSPTPRTCSCACFTPRSGVEPAAHGRDVPRRRHLVPARHRRDRHEVQPSRRTLGPEGQPNEAVGQHPLQLMGDYAASLWFYFGRSPAQSTVR